MAEVYRATHVVDGTTVAVKLLTAASTQRLSHLLAFRNEIRAVAGLDHRHIVQVYAHGQVTTEAAALSDGQLIEGTPYLVMEYVPHSLRTRPPRSWRELSDTLLAVLDGLAHAHARGVIHRDLKAGNVLCGAPDGDVRLTDFGIAHAVEQEPTARAEGEAFAGGTPGYMAPEQLIRGARSHGPWTDLYGLGSTAWLLLTGALPYPEADPTEAWEARMKRPLPTLTPRYSVPAGFEAWLRRMLAPDPAHRFQTAADAAWGLLGLHGDAHGEHASSPLPPEEASTELIAPRMTLVWDDERPGSWTTPQPGTLDPVPPMPRSWRRPAVKRRRLTGEGLELTGLRPLPLVGREAERDQLWRLLSRVLERSRGEAVLLRGPSGAGKSRLARWLAERAQELGIAALVEVRHSPDPGPRDGLGPAVARALRFDGLVGEDAVGWARWHLARVQAPGALAEDVVALAHGSLGSTRERHAVLRRWLLALAHRRPVLVWIDDAPWAGEALAWVEEMLTCGLDAPVLFVLTAADEQLVEQPIEAAAVQQLVDTADATELSLAPLDDGVQTELVAYHLGLHPSLAERVVTRTAGNPLFAVQLVQGWEQRGWLVPSLEGFRLGPRADEALPADVSAAWAERLDALFDDRDGPEALALEVAAALGQDVDLGEWRATCEALALPATVTVIERLLGQALARRPPGEQASFTLVHGMLREAIGARARAAGRFERIQLACAEVLRDREADPARVARHLVLGGEPAPAASTFVEAMRQRQRTAEFAAIRALGREWTRALELAQVPEGDERWGQGWFVQIRACVYTGDVDEAERLCARIQALGERHGWGASWAHAPAERAYIRLRQGAFDEAQVLNHLSAERCTALGDVEGELRALKGLAWGWSFTGRTEEAETLLHEVLARSKAEGISTGLAESWRLLGVCARGRGDWPASEACYREALAAAERHGVRNRVGEAECLGGVGDARRWQGDLDGARRAYGQSRALLESVGLDTALSQLNLAVLDLEQGELSRARPAIEAVVDAWDRPEAGAHAAVPMLALLPCLANAGEWEAWADTRRRALALLEGDPLVDRDVAWLAEFAARSAEDHGHMQDAKALWHLATRQWRACGDESRASTLAR